jgi:hypothetical protein
MTPTVILRARGGSNLTDRNCQWWQLHDSQCRETIKYGLQSHGTRNQEWIYWWGFQQQFTIQTLCTEGGTGSNQDLLSCWSCGPISEHVIWSSVTAGLKIKNWCAGGFQQEFNLRGKRQDLICIVYSRYLATTKDDRITNRRLCSL